MSRAAGKQPTTIQSVMRAISLLEVLALHPGGLTARAVSESCGLNISTCHHLLTTLVHTSMVRLDPKSHLFSLGPKVTQLYRNYTVGTSVVQRIRHLLEDLSLHTLETAYLAGWRDGRAMLIDVVNTVKPGIHQLHPGYTGPAHCRASGKVLLAALTELDLTQYLRRNPLIARTPHTITSEDALRSELELVQTRGYAVDREEYELGWYCVSAPVTNGEGVAVAALAVSFLKERAADLEDLVATVTNMARFASADFGDFL